MSEGVTEFAQWEYVHCCGCMKKLNGENSIEITVRKGNGQEEIPIVMMFCRPCAYIPEDL